MSIFMSIDFFACSQFVSEVQTCVHSKHCLYHLRRDNVCRRLPRWLLGHAWESCSHDGDLLNRIDEANLLVHKLQALVDFDTHCRCGWKKCTQHNSGGTARVQTVGEADKLQTIICMLMTLLTAAKDGILVKLELTGITRCMSLFVASTFHFSNAEGEMVPMTPQGRPDPQGKWFCQCEIITNP